MAKTAAEKKAEAAAKAAASENGASVGAAADNTSNGAEAAAPAEAAPAKAGKIAKDATAVDVFDAKTGVTRTYSLEEQGEDFLELAKEFVSKKSEDRSIVPHKGE